MTTVALPTSPLHRGHHSRSSSRPVAVAKRSSVGSCEGRSRSARLHRRECGRAAEICATAKRHRSSIRACPLLLLSTTPTGRRCLTSPLSHALHPPRQPAVVSPATAAGWADKPDGPVGVPGWLGTAKRAQGRTYAGR
jgi:hypothetical protein